MDFEEARESGPRVFRQVRPAARSIWERYGLADRDAPTLSRSMAYRARLLGHFRHPGPESALDGTEETEFFT